MAGKGFAAIRETAFTLLIGILVCVLASYSGNFIKSINVWAAKTVRPIYSVDTDNPYVSLGINCAWDNKDIPELLSTLRRYNIKATFFISGSWCDNFPHSVKQISDAGHEIGSHSNTHADMTQLDDERLLREITLSRAKLEKASGKPVTLFRVPSGAYNSHVIEMIMEQDMYPIQWDVDSIDYRNPTTEEMRDRILKKTRNGSIMLFHSGAKNTPAALPLIIEAVRTSGYKFVGVSELIFKQPYTVDFEGRQHKLEG